MHDRDQARVARTEALFREVNERIAETAERFESAHAGFVCECADPHCTDRVDTSLAEYERIRADGSTFLTAPGHEEPRCERVVDVRRTFQIVEKLGSLGALARRLDPRASTA